VPIVLKSGFLNLLEPSGPVQACNGIACFPRVTSVTQILKRAVFSFSLQFHAMSFNLSVLRYPQNSVLHSSVYYFSQIDPSFTPIQTTGHITYIRQTSVTEVFFSVILQAFIPLPSSFSSILFSFGSFTAK
jgi:hypothetical protein